MAKTELVRQLEVEPDQFDNAEYETWLDSIDQSIAEAYDDARADFEADCAMAQNRLERGLLL
jgi:hypothetical protein